MISDTTKPQRIAPFLCGERIYLRPLEKDDLSTLRVWSNDPEIRRLTGDVTPMNQTGAERYFDRIQTDENRIWLVIAQKKMTA